MAPSYAQNTHITIRAPTSQTIPALKRLNALLLPINYPESFYGEILSSPTTTRLTKLAFWLHSPTSTSKTNGNVEMLEERGESENDGESQHQESSSEEEQGICVGGVRCRLELPPQTEPSQDSLEPSQPPRGGSIYIMTLCTLSPYRHLGVGTQLITAILSAAVELGCSEVYAHVWEANTDALDWYRKRGFDVSGEVVQGYYRKLRPAGAKVVRRRVGVGDGLAAASGLEIWGAEVGGQHK